jgi:hypothetical protein
MAFPTTDVRVESGAMGLFAKSRHLDPLLESRRKRPGYLGAQTHEFTGIGPLNGWDRACPAEDGLPGCTQQAAFFVVAPAVIVPIEVFAFRTGWCFHMFNVPQVCGTFCFLYTRDIAAITGVHPDGVAFLDEVRHLDFHAGLEPDLLGDASGGIPAHCNLRMDNFQIHVQG